MPYSIRKVGKNKYQVYNTATGEIHSKGTTKKKAEGQFRLLQREIVGDLEGGDLHGNLLKMQQGLHLAGEPFRVLGLPNPYDLGDGIGQALGETIRGGGSGNVTGRRNTDRDIREAIARYERIPIPSEYQYGDYHNILAYEYRIGTIYNNLLDRYEYGNLVHMNPQQLARAIYNTMGGTPETSIHDLELEQSMEEDERTKMGMEDRDAVGRGRRMRGGMLTNQSQEPVKFQLEQFRKHTTFKKPNGTLQLKPPNQIAGKPQTLHRVNLVKGHLNDALRTSNEGYTAERIQYLMDNPNEPITAIDADEQEMLDALVGMGRRMRGGVLEPSEPYVEGETDTEMSDDEAEVGDVADDPLGQPHVWNGQEWVPIAPMEEPDFDNEVFDNEVFDNEEEEGGTDDDSDDEAEVGDVADDPLGQEWGPIVPMDEPVFDNEEEEGLTDDEMEGNGRRMRGGGLPPEVQQRISELRQVIQDIKTNNTQLTDVQRRRITFFQDTIDKLKDPKQTMVATGLYNIPSQEYQPRRFL